MTPKLAAIDRFTAWPVVIALLVVALFFWSEYASINFDGRGTFPTLLISFSVFVADVALLAVRLARWHWRASASVAIALILLVGCFAFRFEIFSEMDRTRFQLFRNDYVSALKVADDPADRPKVIDWGFWGHFLSGAFYRELVYDESDEIDTAAGLRSERVQQALQPKIQYPLSACKISTRRI